MCSGSAEEAERRGVAAVHRGELEEAAGADAAPPGLRRARRQPEFPEKLRHDDFGAWMMYLEAAGIYAYQYPYTCIIISRSLSLSLARSVSRRWRAV
jgi:hypothetical protein